MDKWLVTASAPVRIERVDLAEACWLHVAVDGDGDVVGAVAVDASAGDAARISWLTVDGAQGDADGIRAALVVGVARAAAVVGCARLEARSHPRWAALGFTSATGGRVVRKLR